MSDALQRHGWVKGSPEDKAAEAWEEAKAAEAEAAEAWKEVGMARAKMEEAKLEWIIATNKAAARESIAAKARKTACQAFAASNFYH